MATVDISKAGSKVQITLGATEPFVVNPDPIGYGFDPDITPDTLVLKNVKNGKGDIKVLLTDLRVAGSLTAPATKADALTALKAVFLKGGTVAPTLVSPYKNPYAPARNIYEAVAGGIADSIVPISKFGGATGAVFQKSGDFDEISISGGDYTSFITINSAYVCDNSAVIRAKIRVRELNKNGAATPFAWLGVGGHGSQSVRDTGSPFDGMMAIDLLGKTGVRQGSGGITTNVTVYDSGETLCVNNDILDIEIINNIVNSTKTLRITNKRTGAYVAIFAGGISVIGMGLINSQLRITTANATFALLDYSVEYGEPLERPYIHIIGDSMANGYNTLAGEGLYSQLVQEGKYYYANSAGNGAYIHSIADFQLQDVARTKPTYTLLVTILNSYWGDFVTGAPNNADFMAAWNKLMKGLVSLGTIPIVTCFQEQGYGHAIQFRDFVLAQKASTYPTIIVNDMTAPGRLALNGSFGHPNPNDYIIMKNDLWTNTGI